MKKNRPSPRRHYLGGARYSNENGMCCIFHTRYVFIPSEPDAAERQLADRRPAKTPQQPRCGGGRVVVIHLATSPSSRFSVHNTLSTAHLLFY